MQERSIQIVSSDNESNEHLLEKKWRDNNSQKKFASINDWSLQNNMWISSTNHG